MTTRLIHIVDDDPSVRHSLAFLLMTAGFAVRVHESAQAFLNSLEDPKSACLITDLRMPDIDGVTLLKMLNAKGWQIPTIMISGHGDVPMAVAAMKAGATDFIEKPFEDEVLIEAIHRAYRQDRQPDGADADIQARLENLTPRERQILSGIVAGLPNKTIAYDLEISPRTVEVHRANVMSKLQAKNLPDLVRMTLSLDL